MGKASRRKKLKTFGGAKARPPAEAAPRGSFPPPWGGAPGDGGDSSVQSGAQSAAQSAAQSLYQKQRSRVAEHVARSLAAERSPMALVRLGLEAVRSCEADSEQLLTAHRPDLACRPGCSYCCYPPVSATVPEVANIAAFVLTQLDEAEQGRIRASVEKAYERSATMTSKQRTAANLPCPYLNDQGACSVYPVRPLACRGYNSADAEACRAAFESPTPSEQAVPAFVPLVATAQGLKEGLAAALEGEGLAHPLVDLTKGSRLLLEDLDEPLQTWLDGGDPFSEARPF